MVIRMGVGIWTAVMFKDVGLSAFDAGKCMAALEIGGAVGGMIGGRLSDRLLDGRRGPVMCIFSLICVPLGLALSMLLEVDGDAAYGTDKLLFSMRPGCPEAVPDRLTKGTSINIEGGVYTVASNPGTAQRRSTGQLQP